MQQSDFAQWVRKELGFGVVQDTHGGGMHHVYHTTNGYR